MDPRTPVKKFSALLFKLANVRQQVFKQLQDEFLEVTEIGAAAQSTPEVRRSSFMSSNSGKGDTEEPWYEDFLMPLLERL